MAASIITTTLTCLPLDVLIYIIMCSPGGWEPRGLNCLPLVVRRLLTIAAVNTTLRGAVKAALQALARAYERDGHYKACFKKKCSAPSAWTSWCATPLPAHARSSLNSPTKPYGSGPAEAGFLRTCGPASQRSGSWQKQKVVAHPVSAVPLLMPGRLATWMRMEAGAHVDWDHTGQLGYVVACVPCGSDVAHAVATVPFTLL